MKITKQQKNSIYLSVYRFSMVFIFGLLLVLNTVGAFGGTGDDQINGGGTGTDITVKIENPLSSEIDSIPKFIQAVIKIVLTVGVPIVVLAIIYTGFLFVQAQGNSEKLTKAKDSLLYTLIGAALLLGAFVIAQAIGATVEEISRSV